jgi:hypothetical protein
VIKNGKQSSTEPSSQASVSPETTISGNLVRDVTSKVPLPFKKRLISLTGDHPEIPERGINKDLLLMAREAHSNSSSSSGCFSEDFVERNGKTTKESPFRKRASSFINMSPSKGATSLASNGGSNLMPLNKTISAEQEKKVHKTSLEQSFIPVTKSTDDPRTDSYFQAKQELERRISRGNLVSEDEEDEDEDNESDDEGVPIPLTAFRKTSEQEVAQSLLFLSGSWTDSLKSRDTDEEKPIDLSKRSNSEQTETSDQEEDTDEGVFELGMRNMSGKQDFIPIPLASGAEGGEGKSICTICQKVFSKPSQLRLHVNIHYFERPFRCEACAVSFRTKGHLQKHKRSVSHYNKVNMNKTFGTPSNDNPRPFKCIDCKVAFRIHGHLAKHLRSKLHIMKLECLNKLPFGMFAEMERSGVNLNEIDTSDCENSLLSLQALSRKMSSQPGSSLDISNIQLADADMSDLEEVDDDSDGIIDEIVP